MCFSHWIQTHYGELTGSLHLLKALASIRAADVTPVRNECLMQQMRHSVRNVCSASAGNICVWDTAACIQLVGMEPSNMRIN